MAFFSSSGSEVNEQRLKRSPSFDRLHGRSRRQSGPSDAQSALSDPSARSGAAQSASADRRRPTTTSMSLPRSMQSGPARVLASLEPEHSPRRLQQSENAINQRRTSNPSRSSRAPPSPLQDLSLHATQRSHAISTSERSNVHQSQPDQLGQLPSPIPPPSASSYIAYTQNVASSNFGPHSGSLSDSGVRDRDRSPRRADYLSDSPVRPKIHLSPLDPRHPSPVSPGQRTSGSVSDGGASPDRAASPLLASRLDVKRLLSKPAAPSRASTMSITSDSDSPITSAVRPHTTISPMSSPSGRSDNGSRWPSMSRDTRDVRTRSVGAPMLLADLLPEPNLARPFSSEAVVSKVTAASSSKEKKPRNVLRKTSNGMLARPGASSSSSPASAVVPETSKLSTSTSSVIGRPPISASQLAATSRLTRRISPSGQSSLGNSNSHSPQPSPTPKLTPAGAIARAYKEQDVRREKLAAAARQEDVVVPRSTQGHDEHGDEESGTPYYTVFGGTSGKVVAVGSAEDTAWSYMGLIEADRKTTGSTSGSASAPTSMKQSFGRKVSGRFRRSKATENVGISSNPESDRLGRPSLQERRSTSLPKEHRKSLRLSIDDSFLDMDSGWVPAGTSASFAKRDESSKSTPDGSPASGPGKGKGKEEEPSSGGKLWRLVKRISAGGLRDRYHSGPGTPPPPVPAIPKDLPPMPSRMTLEVHTPLSQSMASATEGGAVGRFMNSRSSMSAVRPSTAPHHGSPATVRAKRPSTGAHAGKGGRPSTSPSQSSSDMASQFFNRSHSARSSSSSYGEELPPLPSKAVLRQSSFPAEQSRHDRSSDEARSRRLRKTHSKHATVDATTSPPSLPQLSRRGTSSDRLRTKPRDSPDIPMFSVSDVVNNFMSRRPTISMPERPPLRIIPPPIPQTEGLPPSSSAAPPRPARSIHRPAPTLPAPSSPTTITASTADFPGTPGAMLSPDPSDVSYRSRDSIGGHSNASTARPTPVVEVSPAVAQLTFREMDNSPRQVWTKKQKEDKWDDLLERSALAGGTLHLGEGGLLSDTIRFSNYSDTL